MGNQARLAITPRWRELASDQAGVISQHQLAGLGFTRDQARQWARSLRWQRLLPGVYATFTGPVLRLAWVWAAVLYAGPRAAASHRTALWLGGAAEGPAGRIELVIPADRRVRQVPGLRIRTRERFDDVVHPAASPPRVRLEEAVLDQAEVLDDVEAVLTLVFGVTQNRLTTADRLRQALGGRARHRRRQLLMDVLADVRDGVQSPLERRFMRDVERAHGLPAAARNRPEGRPGQPGTYRDVRYEKWHTVIELDGQAAHPMAMRFRDFRRDNQVMVEGAATLRFGWHDVVAQPCACALQTATVLRHRGWPGTLRPCGPQCAAGEEPG